MSAKGVHRYVSVSFHFFFFFCSLAVVCRRRGSFDVVNGRGLVHGAVASFGRVSAYARRLRAGDREAKGNVYLNK